MAGPESKFTVCRDSREQQGWTFPANNLCSGTIIKGLKTGDYTLEGLEDVFVLERKGSTGEFSHNLIEARFIRELERLEEFKFAAVILEFSIDDLFIFPVNSGIPRQKWPSLRLTPQFLRAKLAEFELKFRTRFIFAGRRGQECAMDLFKKAVTIYG